MIIRRLRRPDRGGSVRRRRYMRIGSLGAIAGLMLLATARVHNQAASRTLTISTAELTMPALAVTPDGQSLVASVLGHLVLIPAAGGDARQITSGLSYEADPAVSPDGTRVAFSSNRDGSGSNVFVLDLASRRVTQLSRDLESGRPAWSPDGRTIAYVRNLLREDHAMDTIPGFRDTGLRELRTVPAAGGASTLVGPPRFFETIFYLPDGRLAWTVTEQQRGGMSPTIRRTRVETQAADGTVQVLGAAEGNIGRVAPGPSGDGIYYAEGTALSWLPFGGMAKRVAAIQDAGTRLAVTRDGQTLYFGDKGQIWRVVLPSGAPRPVPVAATVRVEAAPLVPPPAWAPPPAVAGPVALHAVLAPQLSPDGRRLVFMAGGFLWEQPVGGTAAAHRLFEDDPAFTRDPVLSPDGRQLAYAASVDGRRELRLYDAVSRQTRVLFTVGGASWAMYPAWSPDGRQIVFQVTAGIFSPFRLMAVDVVSGASREIARTSGSWTARPQFTADGRAIYYTARVDKFAALYRHSLDAGARPAALTELGRHVHEAQVSPDGRWLAFRRNSEIMLAPMGAFPIHDAQVRRFNAHGGRSFAFTHDGSAIVYADRGRVYRQPVSDGSAVEIPVRASVTRAVAPPVVVTRVRVLDLGAGRFGSETSMLVEGGRIRWIGAEQGHQLPAGAVRLDAGGRYAIPGLFDVHVHSAWSNEQTSADAFIAFGLTSIRDTGGTMDVLTALDDRSGETALPAPRYFHSGEIFEGVMPLWGDAFDQIGTAEEARAEARNLKATGARFLKIYPSLPWHLQQVVAEEGHRLGLPLVGHGVSPDEIIRRVIMGFSSVEHNPGLFASYGDIRKLLAASGTALDATLSVGLGNVMVASNPQWAEDSLVREYVPDASRSPGGGARATGPTYRQLLDEAAPRFAKLREARESGVDMLAGTDSMMGGVYFGLALHREIAAFVDAGYTPIQVLRMATQAAADEVGAGRVLGSLTPGKLGDLVLLDKDPLADIRNTLAIWRVMKGGRVYDPSVMRAK